MALTKSEARKIAERQHADQVRVEREIRRNAQKVGRSLYDALIAEYEARGNSYGVIIQQHMEEYAQVIAGGMVASYIAGANRALINYRTYSKPDPDKKAEQEKRRELSQQIQNFMTTRDIIRDRSLIEAREQTEELGKFATRQLQKKILELPQRVDMSVLYFAEALTPIQVLMQEIPLLGIATDDGKNMFRIDTLVATEVGRLYNNGKDDMQMLPIIDDALVGICLCDYGR